MTKRLILQILGACVVGAISASVFQYDAFEAPSGSIVSALSIINAAIFPTVVLSATVLKSAGLNSALIERYRIALKSQIHFFFGILLFSLLSIATIISGQAFNWRFAFAIPYAELHFEWHGIFNFLIAFLGSFVAFRLPGFLRAVVSLLDVHIDGIVWEVAEREKRRREHRQRELSELPDISGHQLQPEDRPIGT